MIKLVVSDFDGTLLQYDKKELDTLIVKRIKALLDKGCSFAVASGRVYSELKEYMSEVADRIFFISSDGALLTYKDKTVFHSPFSQDALAFATRLAKQKNVHIRLFSKDVVYSSKESREFPNDITVLMPHQIKEPVYKIISYKDDIDSFGELYSRFHYSEEGIVEYVPRFANKGSALGALQRHLGVTIYDTLAMGDRNNDIPMMKNAKYRVCVGERSSELRQECDIHADNSLDILQKVWLGSYFCE